MVPAATGTFILDYSPKDLANEVPQWGPGIDVPMKQFADIVYRIWLPKRLQLECVAQPPLVAYSWTICFQVEAKRQFWGLAPQAPLRRTCDLQVAGSSPGWAPLRNYTAASVCGTRCGHNSRKSARGRDRRLCKKRLRGKHGFKMGVKNATRKVNKLSMARAWRWRRAGWWW